MKKDITEIIYEDISNSDMNPHTKEFCRLVAEDIMNHMKLKWEGRFVKGDFFLKTSTGYKSMNSLRKLHDSEVID